MGSRKRAQEEVVGGEIACRPRRGSAHLGGLQGRLNDARDTDRDPLLQLEYFFERAVETVGPQMRAGGRVDQLTGDAYPAAGFAHRAFEHRTDAQLAADLLHVDGLAFVGEARIAGDDEEPAYAAERRHDLLAHAVDKIFLLGIPAYIAKRQERDPRLVGKRQRRWL